MGSSWLRWYSVAHFTSRMAAQKGAASKCALHEKHRKQFHIRMYYVHNKAVNKLSLIQHLKEKPWWNKKKNIMAQREYSEKRNGRRNILVWWLKFSALLLYFLHSNNKWPFINLELNSLFPFLLLLPRCRHRRHRRHRRRCLHHCHIGCSMCAAPQKHMDLHSKHFMQKWRKKYVKRAKYSARCVFFLSFHFGSILFCSVLALAPMFGQHIDVYGCVLLEKWILNNAIVYACVWSIFFAPR